jgi:hypothetical protein
MLKRGTYLLSSSGDLSVGFFDRLGKRELEEEERILVFCTPISTFNLPTFDSPSALFHNYRIWLQAYL